MTQIRHYNDGWLPTIFDDFFDNNWMLKTKATAPAINVAEDEKSYAVEVAAPGMSKEDFNVHVDGDGNLVIAMEKKNAQTEGEAAKRYLRREFSYTKFQQSLILPDDVDKQAIAARVENGVLYVTLPKQTPEQKQELLQTIEVK